MRALLASSRRRGPSCRSLRALRPLRRQRRGRGRTAAARLMRVWLAIAGLVLLIDQVTKQIAEASLGLHEPVTLLPYVNFMLAYKTGAAFSFLAAAPGWQRWIFVVLAVTVSGFIVMWLRRLESTEKLQGVALALILGGAVGYVIDRILFGHVIDFIGVYYVADQCSMLFAPAALAGSLRCHWPAITVAASAKSLGAVIMIVDAVRGHKKRET